MAEEIRDPAGLLAAFNKAKDDLVALRNENTTLKESNAAAAAADADKDSTDESETWRNRAVTAETKLALGGHGIKDVDRLMPYIGTEGISFDEDGKLTGLDERIEKLKVDLPELFDVKRRVGGRADIFADNVSKKELNASEIQARQLIG